MMHDMTTMGEMGLGMSLGMGLIGLLTVATLVALLAAAIKYLRS